MSVGVCRLVCVGWCVSVGVCRLVCVGWCVSVGVCWLVCVGWCVSVGVCWLVCVGWCVLEKSLVGGTNWHLAPTAFYTDCQLKSALVGRTVCA